MSLSYVDDLRSRSWVGFAEVAILAPELLTMSKRERSTWTAIAASLRTPMHVNRFGLRFEVRVSLEGGSECLDSTLAGIRPCQNIARVPLQSVAGHRCCQAQLIC